MEKSEGGGQRRNEDSNRGRTEEAVGEIRVELRSLDLWSRTNRDDQICRKKEEQLSGDDNLVRERLKTLSNSERRCGAQQRTPQKDGPKEYEWRRKRKRINPGKG